jgi:serine/threonine protein phosphatase PrpC
MLNEEQILNILQGSLQNIEIQADSLVKQANENGGEDNITLILIEKNSFVRVIHLCHTSFTFVHCFVCRR